MDRSLHSPRVAFMWWSDSGSRRFGYTRTRQYFSLRFPWGKSFSIVWRAGNDPNVEHIRSALDEKYRPGWAEPLDAVREKGGG